LNPYILEKNENEKKVTICAWCDEDGALSKEYNENGYWVRHGVCKDHSDTFIEEFRKSYGTENIQDIDGGGDDGSNGLPIISGNAKE
jgi:hypothetical protein